jgi:3-oxoacyl-[acyl-carrier-protein] synthase-3
MLKNITTHLPSGRLSNEQLVAELGRWSADEIFAKTGIRERCVAAPGVTATDLGREALAELLRQDNAPPPDFLLFCTQSLDYKVPTSACILQDAAGLPTSCGAADINLGCSGFIYGLAMGEGLLAAGLADKVALVTSETYTKYIHPQDTVSRPIFGDGAAATLLAKEGDARAHSFVFGTDGAHAQKLFIPAGGSRQSSAELLATQRLSGIVSKPDDPEFIHMNGPEIFNFTLQAVPKLVSQVLSKAETAFEEIDYFVFHQANAFMLEALRRKIKIPSEKFIVDMADTGNLVSASIPVVLRKMLEKGLLTSEKRLLLCGFGTGLSWAGCILDWKPQAQPQPQSNPETAAN